MKDLFCSVCKAPAIYEYESTTWDKLTGRWLGTKPDGLCEKHKHYSTKVKKIGEK